MVQDNINTDQIIPSREMKRVSKTGLADGLFANLRYGGGARTPNPDFILNQPPFQRASILLAGQNMGCGSSREHAVWALKDYGFRVVLAVGFASIFRTNCVANGIIPGALRKPALQALAQWVALAPAQNLPAVDLEAQIVSFAGTFAAFEISDTDRKMLMKGLSPIDMTLEYRAQIAAFSDTDRARRPWLYQ